MIYIHPKPYVQSNPKITENGSSYVGKSLGRLVVCCWCDNNAVVAVVNRRTNRDQDLMHLLHCLSFFEAAFPLGW